MRLFYSPFHDFAHKVLVVAHEAGVADEITTVPSFPFRNLTGEWVAGRYDTTPINPLGKVPFLALDDGTVLYQSQVVAEYLDSLSKGRPLYPPGGLARFDALRRLSLGDALFEFAVQMSMECWREPAARRAGLFDWLWPKVVRSLDLLDEEARGWGAFDIGHAGILQGVSYIDGWASGRHDIPGNPCADWRRRWPALAGWLEQACARPSVAGHYRRPYAGDTSPEQHRAAVEAVLAAREACT
jgi:glutathione S-transferase